jgi:hypothetical protein
MMNESDHRAVRSAGVGCVVCVVILGATMLVTLLMGGH